MVLYCYLPLPLCIIIQLGVIKADVIKHVLILDKRLVLAYNKEHRKIPLENSLPTLFNSNTMTRVTIKVIFFNGNSISFKISLMDLRYYYCSCSQTSFHFISSEHDEYELCKIIDFHWKYESQKLIDFFISKVKLFLEFETFILQKV